jgi:hypothetical protein
VNTKHVISQITTACQSHLCLGSLVRWLRSVVVAKKKRQLWQLGTFELYTWQSTETLDSSENSERPSLPAAWIVTDTSSHTDKNEITKPIIPLPRGAGAALQLQVLRYFVLNATGATVNGVWAGELDEQTSDVIGWTDFRRNWMNRLQT